MRSRSTPGRGADHVCCALLFVPESKINVTPVTPLHGVPVHSFRTPSSTRKPAAGGSDGANCASVSHAAAHTTSRAAQTTRAHLAISAIGKARAFLGLVATGDLLPCVGREEPRVALARPLLGVALLVVEQPVHVERARRGAAVAVVPGVARTGHLSKLLRGVCRVVDVQ